MKRVLILLLIQPFIFGCPATPTQPDEVPTEAPREVRDFNQIPEYQELSLLQGELEVVELGSSDGVSAFRIGSLEVLHLPTPANEVVAARLYFRGGVAALGEETAGIERLALSVAANGGTTEIPRDEFNARLDRIGSSIGFISDRDFSALTMNSVREYFDETWELFEGAIFEPAFPDDEVERRRDRQSASIETIGDDPDRLVNEVARDLTFGDHPYSLRELGTLETLRGFQADDLRSWQRSLLSPDRMVLVVVGNVDREELVEKLTSRLARVPFSTSEVPEIPAIPQRESSLRIERMSLPTNYILGYYAAPSMEHPDYPALVLATRHLRDRLFEEVRTRRNLTYAVSAGLGNRRANVGFLYVTAVDPEATMPVIFAEVERMKEVPLSETELQEVRNVFLTSHYMGLETNSSIAGQLATATLIGGDWSLHGRFLEGINRVTAEDIQRVSAQYMQGIHFGVVGSPDDMSPALFGVSEGHDEEIDEH